VVKWLLFVWHWQQQQQQQHQQQPPGRRTQLFLIPVKLELKVFWSIDVYLSSLVNAILGLTAY